MRHVSNPDEYLVISTWDNLEDWEKWVSSPPRKALQDKIDKLLGKKTTYDIYHYPEKRYHKAEPSDYWSGHLPNPRNNPYSLASRSGASASSYYPAATSPLPAPSRSLHLP